MLSNAKGKVADNKFSRRRAVLVASFIFSFFISGQASADWRVSDKTAQDKLDTANNNLDKIYNKLDQMYKQDNLAGAVFNVDEKPTKNLQDADSKLEKRGEEDFVSSRCRDEKQSAINDTQKGICVDIVKKENKLFNYLIDMLVLTKDRQGQLKEILKEREGIQSGKDTEIGKLESNTNRLLALQTQIQIDDMNLKLTLDSYDRYLAGRKSELADATRNLTRGDGGGLISQAKSAAAMAALGLALEAAHLYKTNAQH